MTGAVRSKYESIGEFDNGGHSSVWGSFWHKQFGWGYKCCMSFAKYRPGDRKCRGEAGKQESLKNQIELEVKQQNEKRMKLKRKTSGE